MADINIDSGLVISDANKDIALPAFLAACPIPVDNETGDPLYATTKLWVEAWLKKMQKKKLLKTINIGIDMLNRASTQGHLTSL